MKEQSIPDNPLGIVTPYTTYGIVNNRWDYKISNIAPDAANFEIARVEAKATVARLNQVREASISTQTEENLQPDFLAEP